MVCKTIIGGSIPPRASKISGPESGRFMSAKKGDTAMSKILSEVLEANQNYSSNFGEKGKLALPPARSFAILTCMDARLDPASTREFFVVHHTDCGMEFFTNDVMRHLLASSLETAALTPQGFKDVGKGPGSRAGEYIEWLTISNQKQAVLDDVARIRNHPLVPKSIPVYGFLYDVRSGKLLEVEGAKAAGAAA